MSGLSFILLCTPLLFLYSISADSQHTSVNTDLYCYYRKDCKEIYWRDEHIQPHLLTNPAPQSLSNTDIEMTSSSMNGFYRPRSALARAIYEKHRNDMHLEQLDKNEWYQVNSSLLTDELKEKFVQLGPDEDTKEFLSTSIDKSSWVWTQIWYLIAKAVLRRFWSITDINGWLGRGSMFVLSSEQAARLLARTASRGCLVDVGAGDGEVSGRFAHLYTEKYATEISTCMRKALVNKGYTLLDTGTWWQSQRFDCVAMLNLLDRCSSPLAMLRQARAALAPGGALLLALVLPYKPYVEVTPNHKPDELLPIEGSTFEEQVVSFVQFMDTLGFELSSWTRAPYLCEGDFAQAYYWLDDSVYVFKTKNIPSHT